MCKVPLCDMNGTLIITKQRILTHTITIDCGTSFLKAALVGKMNGHQRKVKGEVIWKRQLPLLV